MAEKQRTTSEPHVVSSGVANDTNDPMGRFHKVECKHDWQYNFETHIHECSKCKTPAPPNWNEVPF